ncbi:zincin [Auricularia subglabra TFB-10046 SS5]|nr:zincin [Auricularia subglabra TFB-10046 SS5]
MQWTALSALVLASVVSIHAQDSKTTLLDVELHSCNATQTRMLRAALEDTYELANGAREYILEKGANDDLYKTYFGTAKPEDAAAIYEGLINGPKDGVLLRCDDIDGNCKAHATYAGHWRNENATKETVICDLSYEIRKTNEEFCMFGYTVAQSSTGYYWSTDLIHRFFHVPNITVGVVDHHADKYEECLALAKDKPELAILNTHSLQYFAADVYARTVALPPNGCLGEVKNGNVNPTSTSGAPAPCRESLTSGSIVVP